jgi:hypothetical protein
MAVREEGVVNGWGVSLREWIGLGKLTPPLRDASPVKENKPGGASYLSISCRCLPGISTEYRIQVLSLRANDLCFRAG